MQLPRLQGEIQQPVRAELGLIVDVAVRGEATSSPLQSGR
jgi:hypothetical protein